MFEEHISEPETAWQSPERESKSRKGETGISMYACAGNRGSQRHIKRDRERQEDGDRDRRQRDKDRERKRTQQYRRSKSMHDLGT